MATELQIRTALETVGRELYTRGMTSGPGFDAMSLLWEALITERGAVAVETAQRKERNGENMDTETRQEIQEAIMIKYLRRWATTDKRGMERRMLTQRLYGLSDFRHAPDGPAKAIENTLAQLIDQGKASYDNAFVTINE